MDDFTITSKEAVLLTWKAQECLSHDMFFAHALLSATEAELATLRGLIKRANTLRATKMDEDQEKVHRGVKLTDRMLRARQRPAQTPPELRRLHRVKPERIAAVETNE